MNSKKRHSFKYNLIANIKTVAAMRVLQPIWSRLLLLSLYGLGFRNTEKSKNGEEWLHANLARLFPRFRDRAADETGLLLDVGANRGEFAASFLQNNPGFKAICVEPNTTLGPKIASNTSNFDCTVIHCAVSSETGPRRFYRPKNPAISHFASLDASIGDEHEVEEIVVEARALDDIAEDLDVGYVDYLKIDVEGAEQEVLNSARQLLETGRVGIVQVEFTERTIMNGLSVGRMIEAFPEHTCFQILPRAIVRIRGIGDIRTKIMQYNNIVMVPNRLL